MKALNPSESDIEEIKKILCGSFLFEKGAAPSASFLSECELKEFAAGEVIYSGENFLRALAVMITGKAVVTKRNALLKNLEKGGIFGASAMFGSKSESFATSVSAKTKAKVLFIPQETVTRLISENTSAALGYIGFLSDRVRFLNEKIDSFTSENGMERLAKYLLSFESAEFHLPISVSKLAETLNIGRATLYRSLTELEADRIIGRNDRDIEIINTSELKRLAGKGKEQ